MYLAWAMNSIEELLSLPNSNEAQKLRSSRDFLMFFSFSRDYLGTCRTLVAGPGSKTQGGLVEDSEDG